MDQVISREALEAAVSVLGGAAVAGLVAGFAFLVVRRFLMSSGDELKEVGTDIAPRVARAVLRRRRGMPATPWFCATCRSRNGEAASRCYRCGAERATAEAEVPDASEPAGPSAGRSMRRG